MSHSNDKICVICFIRDRDGNLVARVEEPDTGNLVDSVPSDVRTILSSLGYAEEREGHFIRCAGDEPD